MSVDTNPSCSLQVRISTRSILRSASPAQEASTTPSPAASHLRRSLLESLLMLDTFRRLEDQASRSRTRVRWNTAICQRSGSREPMLTSAAARRLTLTARRGSSHLTCPRQWPSKLGMSKLGDWQASSTGLVLVIGVVMIVLWLRATRNSLPTSPSVYEV